MRFKPGNIVVPNLDRRHNYDGIFYGVDAWDNKTNLTWFRAGHFGFVMDDPVIGSEMLGMVLVLDICDAREILVFADDLVLAEVQ